jgi:adenylylsulfate kinase
MKRNSVFIKRADRERMRGMVQHGDFIEIFCDSTIEICEQRDVKGMYKKARAGQIKDFTGISAPYEKPENEELTVNTGTTSLEECVRQVIGEINQRGIIASGNNLQPNPGR